MADFLPTSLLYISILLGAVCGGQSRFTTGKGSAHKDLKLGEQQRHREGSDNTLNSSRD